MNDDASDTPALDRGLAIFELLATQRVPLRAVDMLVPLGIPKGSLNRILRTLVAQGWLSRDERTLTYVLTNKLLTVGSATVCERNLNEEAIGIIRELRDASGETAHMSVLVGDRGVVLEGMSSPQHAVRIMVDPGNQHYLHNAAPGKVLLAYLPEAQREALLSRLDLIRETDHTITNLGALRADLAGIRAVGYGTDAEENFDGVCCASAPVFDRHGTCVAALTITGPSARVRRDLFPRFGAMVAIHAQRISQRLGLNKTTLEAQS